MSNSNKVALITGGSRGIGFGIAACLAGDGHSLAICGMREEEAVKDALAELRGTGVDVLYCRADVSDPEARTRMLSEISQ